MRLAPAFRKIQWEQLWGAIGAVFTSWMNTRAITYRRLNNIPAGMGNSGQYSGHGFWQYG
jgi:pyruvate,orthophosphate dikinase